MHHQDFSWQNLKGLNIYSQSWKPEGNIRAQVTLVHGLGEHSGRYQHVADAFSQMGIGLTAMDLPGHGRSGGARGYTAFDEILNDIDRLLSEASARFPGVPNFLYGHSMGGQIALYYTLKCRPSLSGVIASSPSIAHGKQVPASKILLAKVMARLLPGFTLSSGLDVKNLSRDPHQVQAYQQDSLVHDRVSARLGLDILTLGSWILAQAAEFPVPLLLVQGSKDEIVSPDATRRFAKAVPPEKITYKVWEGFFHETHNEPEKEQVIRYMVNWIRTVCGTI